MNRKPQQTMQGMNRISRLLPHLAVGSDLTLPCMEFPLLDGRNLRAMVAHCVNLGDLINFFETINTPFGTWGDILLLCPELASACILEQAAQQEQMTGVDRPTRITTLVQDLSLVQVGMNADKNTQAHMHANTQSHINANTQDLSLSNYEKSCLIDVLIQEELDWQNTWIERFEKIGAALLIPPFPDWPKERKTEQGNEKNIGKEQIIGKEQNAVKEQIIEQENEQNYMANKAYLCDTALRIALRRSLLLDAATAIWEKAISCPDGNLSPHVGMLFAFLERYSRLQQICNKLVPLYTSYFYEKVMGFSPRPALPDRVLACFNSLPWSTVPRGSILAMPSLSFVTESSVPFSQTLLEQLRAIIPAVLPSPFALSNVQIKEENRLWVPFKNTTKNTILPKDESPDKNAVLSNSLGVGSTLFTLPGMELNGGSRKLVFSFELESENTNAISNLKEAWKNRPKDFFAVTISGEDGWLSPSKLSFSLSFDSDISENEQFEPNDKLLFLENNDDENSASDNDNSKLTDKSTNDQENVVMAGNIKENDIKGFPRLIVSLTLEANQSAIFAPQEDIHGLSSEHPVMRFMPRIVESTLWQALNSFHIKNMGVDIRVYNLQTCEFTIDGSIIPNPQEGDVEIFGAMPKHGSSFVLTVPELAQKHISSLNLSWQWEVPNQFDSYFRAYPFKPIYLIPAIRKDDGLWHNMDILVALLGKFPQKLNCPIPKSGKITAWRWSLSSQGSLFGHKDYPHLLARAIIDESSILRQIWAKITNKTRLKDINIPLVPKWSDIAVDYKAWLHWDVNSTQIVTHEHPWAGAYERYPQAPRLFPHYDKHSLCMTFSRNEEKEQGIPLSLYCRLQNLSPDGKGPAMSVHGADIWKDETNGLTSSGIMGLTPHNIWVNKDNQTDKNTDNNVADNVDATISELFHVRLDWADMPHIALQNVHENAVWAIYDPIDDEAINARSFPLPANTLATVDKVIAPKSGNKGIAHDFVDLKVSQPYASIGGRSQGGLNMESYYQDCAEELLHRGQAILPRDFERLLLREFPDVLLALCIPHSSENLTGTSPGSVSLVVFAPPDGAKIHGDMAQNNPSFTLDPYLPAYADAELMRQMTKYIDMHASPYAKLALMHPVYQKVDAEVRIYCDIMKNPVEAEKEIRSFLEQNIAPWAFEPSITVFDQVLNIFSLRGKLEAFSWVLEVKIFNLSVKPEMVSLSLHSSSVGEAQSANEAVNANEIILAGVGGLFYPNELQITCIRGKEKGHD